MARCYKIPLLAGALAWLGLLGLAANPASAAPISVTLVGGAPTTGGPGGTFIWTYEATIAENEGVRTGDFFTIYDFQGFAGFGPVPAGWSTSSPNTGPTLAGLPVFTGDDPAIQNVAFTRTGAAIPANPGAGQNLGTFQVFSTIGATQTGSFTGQTEVNGLTQGSTGFVPVPVPEPATLLLALAGPVFLFGAVRRGLRRRQA